MMLAKEGDFDQTRLAKVSMKRMNNYRDGKEEGGGQSPGLFVAFHIGTRTCTVRTSGSISFVAGSTGSAVLFGSTCCPAVPLQPSDLSRQPAPPAYTPHRHRVSALNANMFPAFISWRLGLVGAIYPILCLLTTSLQPLHAHAGTHKQLHNPHPPKKTS